MKEFLTERFGALTYDEARVIQFPQGLPGLEEKRAFILVRTEETDPIFWLQSMQDAQIALPVVEVFSLDPDYQLDIEDEDAAQLKIEKATDVLVLAVVVIPEDVSLMSANMAAPIVLQPSAGLGKQLYSNNAAYAVRTPIFEKVTQMIKEEVVADAGLVKES